MGRKVIFSLDHLRRMGNEGPMAWKSRNAVTRSFLAARMKFPKCCFKLIQEKQDFETGQRPDFTLECAYGRKWAIEIGITGTARVEVLEFANFNVLRVGRGMGFDFERRIGPGRTCSARCKRHLG